LALALCWVIRAGFEQHFGGLEATRHFLNSMKDSITLPPGILDDPAYLRRIASSRIFATFSGNPDALAGGIELLLPVTLVFLWQITPKVRLSMRWAFVAILGGCGLTCLYWSGSKAGWLVTLVVGMVALCHSTLPIKWKRALICGVFILGLAGFGIRYAASVEKQKVSVSTRFTYWRSALQIAAQHPVLGAGPGTFQVLYKHMMRPEDDFARLCHNDYLEQACDSGVPGFIIYTVMIVGYLSRLYRYRVRRMQGCNIYFAVWLGMLGLCLHSTVDYHLYIPALAWPMFFLMGFALNYKD
jgi:O-antigen ligase